MASAEEFDKTAWIKGRVERCPRAVPGMKWSEDRKSGYVSRGKGK
jgi:hypothetical protein